MKNLTPITDKTITDPVFLMKELQEIREKGYASSMGELYDGVASYAAPIFDYTGEIKYSLGCGMPLQRVNKQIEQKAIDLLVQGAREISRQLGYKINEQEIS